MIKDKKNKLVFTNKPYDSFLYKWSPNFDVLKKSNSNFIANNPTGCNALPYSQGEDWVTTYVYNYDISTGTLHQFAYVECDYVK